MVNLSLEDICTVMQTARDIRNVCVIAVPGQHHGRASLIDVLLNHPAVVRLPQARFTDTEQCQPFPKSYASIEEELSDTYVRTPSFLFAHMSHEVPSSSCSSRTAQLPGCLINLIVTQGEEEEGGSVQQELAPALRMADGAFLVVDCTQSLEGVALEHVMKQTVSASLVKPLLVLNKFDILVRDIEGTSAENIYQVVQKCRSCVARVNHLIASHEIPLVCGEWRVRPACDQVVFASALQNWGFSLSRFARLYAVKFGLDEGKLVKKLWGNHFYDRRRKVWTTETGENNTRASSSRRGFDLMCIAPIRKIIEAAMDDDVTKISTMLSRIGLSLSADERERTGRHLMKAALRRLLPVGDSLLDVCVAHLPPAPAAQRYRVGCLCPGPQDWAATAIRECDPSGPLVVGNLHMVPATSCRRRQYAFGRVLSGTVSVGQAVKVRQSECADGLSTCHISHVMVTVTRRLCLVESVAAGNIVGLRGIEEALACLVDSGTMITGANVHE